MRKLNTEEFIIAAKKVHGDKYNYSLTYLNIQANAVDWVKKALETRRIMRRARRFRKTPYRACRLNRSRKPGWIPPSTLARWNWKLRLINWLRKLFPISEYIVEDIAARAKKGARRWNQSFSPLEQGKNWFYEQVRKLGRLTTMTGYETKALRDAACLTKNSNKLADTFDAHCVDSWAMANYVVGGHTKPDNTAFLKVVPLRWHRRQLHALQPTKGGVRRNYGSTRSLGLSRGSLVRHLRWGRAIVGGNSRGNISLHDPNNFGRICRNANPADCKFLTILPWLSPQVPRVPRVYQASKKECDSPAP